MKKALVLDPISFHAANNNDLFIEESDVSITPTPSGIVQAGSNSKIDPNWIQAPLDISILPVADDGEVSSTELVRADDSRLGNTIVGGDLSGTTLSATVVGLQGRPLLSTSPTDGQAIVWNNAQGRWEPGSGSGTDAVSIQGNPVSSTVPISGDVLEWNGTAWTPSAPSGGSGSSASPGLKRYLYGKFW